MNQLEKIFSNILSSTNKYHKKLLITDLTLQIKEYIDFTVPLLQTTYTLLTSETWDDRILGATLLGSLYPSHIKYKIDFTNLPSFSLDSHSFFSTRITSYTECSVSFQEQQNLITKKLGLTPFEPDNSLITKKDVIIEEVKCDNNRGNKRGVRCEGGNRNSKRGVSDKGSGLESASNKSSNYKGVSDSTYKQNPLNTNLPTNPPNTPVLSKREELAQKRKNKLSFEKEENETEEIKIQNTNHFFIKLYENLLSVEWTKRHGAFLGFCSIFMQLKMTPLNSDCEMHKQNNYKYNQTAEKHKKEEIEGRGEELEKEEGEIAKDGTNTQPTTNPSTLNTILLNSTLISSILQILYHDKFNDFISDKTTAPVRESSSHLLSLIFPFLSTELQNYIFKILFSFLENTDWQIQCSALNSLILLKEFIITNKNTNNTIFINKMINLMKSEDEDVKYLSADLIIPFINMLCILKGNKLESNLEDNKLEGVNNTPYKQRGANEGNDKECLNNANTTTIGTPFISINTLKNKTLLTNISYTCWMSLQNENEIALSKTSILRLITEIYKLGILKHFDLNKITPCFRSPLIDVRSSVISMMECILKGVSNMGSELEGVSDIDSKLEGVIHTIDKQEDIKDQTLYSMHNTLLSEDSLIIIFTLLIHNILTEDNSSLKERSFVLLKLLLNNNNWLGRYLKHFIIGIGQSCYDYYTFYCYESNSLYFNSGIIIIGKESVMYGKVMLLKGVIGSKDMERIEEEGDLYRRVIIRVYNEIVGLECGLEGVNNNTSKEEGLNHSTSKEEGLNILSNEEHPFNHLSNEKYSFNNTNITSLPNNILSLFTPFNLPVSLILKKINTPLITTTLEMDSIFIEYIRLICVTYYNTNDLVLLHRIDWSSSFCELITLLFKLKGVNLLEVSYSIYMVILEDKKEGVNNGISFFKVNKDILNSDVFIKGVSGKEDRYLFYGKVIQFCNLKKVEFIFYEILKNNSLYSNGCVLDDRSMLRGVSSKSNKEGVNNKDSREGVNRGSIVGDASNKDSKEGVSNKSNKESVNNKSNKGGVSSNDSREDVSNKKSTNKNTLINSSCLEGVNDFLNVNTNNNEVTPFDNSINMILTHFIGNNRSYLEDFISYMLESLNPIQLYPLIDLINIEYLCLLVKPLLKIINGSYLKDRLEGVNYKDGKEGVNDKSSKEVSVSNLLDKQRGVNEYVSNYEGVNNDDKQHTLNNTISTYHPFNTTKYRNYALMCFSKIIPLLVISIDINKVSNTFKERVLENKRDIDELIFNKERTPYKIEVPIKVVLRDYQVKGIQWIAFMCKYSCNGVLADDMGLGKTIQVLTYIANELYKYRKVKGVNDSDKVYVENKGVKGMDSKEEGFKDINSQEEGVSISTTKEEDVKGMDSKEEGFKDINSQEEGVSRSPNKQKGVIPKNTNLKGAIRKNKIKLVKRKNTKPKGSKATPTDDNTPLPTSISNNTPSNTLNNNPNNNYITDYKVLVICPSSLTGHWLSEVNNIFPTLTAGLYKTESYSSDITILSYDNYRNNYLQICKINWYFIILDEGHLLRNRDTVIYKRILLLKSTYKIILTGTPIQNTVDDIFSLFNILMPEYLGTEKEFIFKFKNINYKDKTEEEYLRMEKSIEELHKKILPFVLRRMKSDVLKDLPPKVIRDIVIEMSEYQRGIYNEIEGLEGGVSDEVLEEGVSDKGTKEVGVSDKSSKDVVVSYKGANHLSDQQQCVNNSTSNIKGVNNTNITPSNNKRPKFTFTYSTIDKKSNTFLKLSKLLKVCSHLSLIGVNTTYTNSCKMKALEDLLNLCGGTDMRNKVLIFCQLKNTIDFIIKDLIGVNYNNMYCRLDGGVNIKDRSKVVEDFNKGSKAIMLLTTNVGGLGLNLTSADTVIFYEHDWNPFNDLQAMDRAHRIGQKKTVNVFRLIVKDTIEERVMNLQAFKMHVASSLISQQNTDIEKMETSGLLERFG